MKNGWEIKTLDQISTNLDSRRVPITKGVRVNGKYPYYGASGIVDYVAGYIFDEDALLISEDGANLLARATPIAFPASGKYWVNNHAHILKFENLTTQRFVELFLESIPLNGYITGAAQPKLNQKALNSIPIPVPRLPEQKRIVHILDEIFEGIATAKADAEKNVQNARALFESHLQSVFTQRGDGWVETTLEQATAGVFTGPFGSLLHKSDYVANGIPLVNPAHITDTGIEPDLSKTVSRQTAKRLEGYIMRKGDIVIGRRGEMGRCALVTEAEDGWLCGTGSFFIKPSSRCDTRYLVRFLRSCGCRERLEKLAGGAVMPNLSNTALAALPINLPPLERQNWIVEEIDNLASETQHLESIYERKLAALGSLKKSLLHEAFAGNL